MYPSNKFELGKHCTQIISNIYFLKPSKCKLTRGSVFFNTRFAGQLALDTKHKTKSVYAVGLHKRVDWLLV